MTSAAVLSDEREREEQNGKTRSRRKAFFTIICWKLSIRGQRCVNATFHFTYLAKFHLIAVVTMKGSTKNSRNIPLAAISSI